MLPLLADIRCAARRDGNLPERCELCGREGGDLQIHHVGGKAYGGFPVRLCSTCHKEATRRQASYAHLLRLPDPPPWVVEMVWKLDVAAITEMIAERGRLHVALLERLAVRERERTRDAVAPHLCNPKERALLKHPNTRRVHDE